MEKTLPVKCYNQIEPEEASRTRGACRTLRPPPSAMLTGKISSMQGHCGARLQHCTEGERVSCVPRLSVVAVHADSPWHWQKFFHQPSQPLLLPTVRSRFHEAVAILQRYCQVSVAIRSEGKCSEAKRTRSERSAAPRSAA